MRWWKYEEWCESRGMPVLVVPQGLKGINDRVYSDDGYLYVRGKKIDRYMVVQRYNGFDCLVKRDHINDIARFEKLRWGILCHIQKLLAKHQMLGMEIYDLVRNNRGPHDKIIYGMIDGVLHCVEIVWGKYDGLKADGGRVGGFDDKDPLEKMAMIPRSDQEQRLTERWHSMRKKIDKYWAKAGNYSHALAALFRAEHPVTKEPNKAPYYDRRAYYDRPVIFEVNGRLYPISVGLNASTDMKYWPDPMGLSPIKIV